MHWTSWKNTPSRTQFFCCMRSTPPNKLKCNRRYPGAEGTAAFSAELRNARAALEWSTGPHGNDRIAKRLGIAIAALDRKPDGMVSPAHQRAPQILKLQQSSIKAAG